MFRTSIRGLHYRLPQLGGLKTSADSLPGLFSQSTVSQLWFDRSQKIIDTLNAQLEDHVKSDETEMLLPRLIEQTIKNPATKDVYTNATLLYNSQFFFESIQANDEVSVEIASVDALLETPLVEFVNQPTDDAFVNWINTSFGSVEEFRTLLLNSAMGINGDGYTWLVAVPQPMSKNQQQQTFPELRVVNTYGAGYVDDVFRGQQLDKIAAQRVQMEEVRKQKNQNQEEELVVAPEEDKLKMGTIREAEQAVKAFEGKTLVPLLAIDASPRAYLRDFGVFGKQRYLNNVWECLDWNTVTLRAPKRHNKAVMH